MTYRHIGTLTHDTMDVTVKVYGNGYQRVAVFQDDDAPGFAWPARTPLTQIATEVGPGFSIARIEVTS